MPAVSPSQLLEMHGASVPEVTVKVDGAKLGDQHMQELLGAMTESSQHLPDMFELRFFNSMPQQQPTSIITDAKLKIGSTVEVAVNIGGRGDTPLVTGEIATIETEFSVDGYTTTIRGYDPSYRLTKSRRAEAYQQMSVADIARKIAGTHSLTVKGSSGGPLEHVLQPGITDWDFLHRLAASEGLAISCRDGEITLASPRSATAAATGQAVVIGQLGQNLISLRCSLTASDQVPRVEVRGWDPQAKQAVVARAAADTTMVAIPGLTPAAMGRELGGSDVIVQAPGLTVSTRATDLANGVANELGELAEIEGSFWGFPTLRADDIIELKDVAEFSGKYVLTKVRHTIEDGGYITTFTVSAGADRSTHGVMAGARSSRGSGIQLLPAIVTNNNDPLNQGRVKFKLPTLSDLTESWWAQVVLPGSGTDRGFHMVPAVNDTVLVAVSDDPTVPPWVLGGLYNGKDKPLMQSADVGEGDAWWVSKTGMAVRLVEKSGEERIELTLSFKDSPGKDAIVIAKDTSKGITIMTQGPVSITAQDSVNVEAKKDVSVKTGTGKVNIEGNEVTIKGTQKVSIEGVELTMKGTAKAELSGAQTKVAGQATVELSSSGIATVRGSLVKIN